MIRRLLERQRHTEIVTTSIGSRRAFDAGDGMTVCLFFYSHLHVGQIVFWSIVFHVLRALSMFLLQHGRGSSV